MKTPCEVLSQLPSGWALIYHEEQCYWCSEKGYAMRERLVQKYRRLQLLCQEKRLAHALLATLYSRQVQYITLRRLDPPAAATAVITKAAREMEIECLVVDSPAALAAVAREIPAAFRDSVETLTQRVAQGCVVVLAWRPRQEGSGKEVVGYNISERGVFSALGRRSLISADVVFEHYMEVLPAYRGQRIVNLLSATRDEYFRQRGVRIRCGVISPQNHAALRSSPRKGSTIVGTVQRLSLLRGLFVWETPWEHIERAVCGVLSQINNDTTHEHA